MSYETILYDVGNDGVATITLNRPDRLNAFNRMMGAEFRDVWATVKADHGVRAVVLRASDCPAFCTGVDVKEGGWTRPEDGPWDATDPGEVLGPKSNHVWKPVILATHGMVAGGAFYWLNEADIILCSEDAQFFDPHVTFGMVAACEPIGALARMPLGEVIRMTLLGNDERMSAQTALRISLVTEVTPTREELWKRAHEIASAIAAKPAAAIQGSVRAIWEALDMPRHAAMTNALKYTQLGNPIGRAEVDRWSAPKATWRLR
ncbi:enoyl-CoA hydratase/isomerase family protein [Roseomonas sp. JC162]|uniref:Enoyl-CoA hydratase/isomerase family protein n=1 Tax=Neoroseomonas marina TaxID=1232220 RepID=A0A848EM46_9PROT|nr:enoyl-CoA hydratase/isomerase family protein [Neoroseomonas marina]NMJ44443.1 enoyl-CoA hydratase/isomerase family protein [Neoroseomonas marina]